MTGSDATGEFAAVRRIPFVPLLFLLGGSLVLLLAVSQARSLLRDGSILVALLDLVFIGGPGGALVYAGYWLPRSDISRRYYSRITAWVVGGVAVMFGFILLRDAHPGVTAQWSIGTQAIALTIGSIGGLLIGVQETKATMRTAQLEQRTTELEEREAQLERQNEQLEQFANVVSHDLRNPLNVAKGRVDIERSHRESEDLEVAADALDRMEGLITDVLTMARQGHDVEETETVSLESVVERCWESVRTDDATVEVTGDLRFKADLDRSKHLFENLFRNAVEHGGEAIAVRIGPLSDGDGFYIEDDGAGIPESERGHVFETGYSTGDDGIGIGLSIVAGVTAAHGWTISVENSTSGGARFEISSVVTA